MQFNTLASPLSFRRGAGGEVNKKSPAKGLYKFIDCFGRCLPRNDATYFLFNASFT